MECIKVRDEQRTKRAIDLVNDHNSRGELDFLDPCNDYMSPLLLAVKNACRFSDYKLLNILLDNKQSASVNFEDSCRRTPLMLAAWKGHDTVCRILLNRNANVHKSPIGVIASRYCTPFNAAINALVHVGDTNRYRDQQVKTAALMMQQGARFWEPVYGYKSNFIATIVPLLTFLRNDSGSLTNAKIQWESLMYVVINMPTTHDNGITNEQLEDTAIGIMKLRGYATQKPLSKHYFFPKESLFHLAAYKGFKKLLNFLLRWNKAYLTERWIVDNKLHPSAKPSDDIVAKLRSWRKGPQITYFTV